MKIILLLFSIQQILSVIKIPLKPFYQPVRLIKIGKKE
jgi:hypothetical protein